MVAIFPSLAGESLEDFSVRVAQAWRIGQKGLDSGVVFLVFLQDRKMRIEVGYGLEPTLTDAIAGTIIRDVVTPRFREGRLADGIGAGLDAIEAAIKGTYAAPARRRGAGNPLVLVGLALIVLTMVPLLLLSAFQNRATRRHGWTGSRQGWSGGGGFGGPFWGAGGGWGGGGGGGGGFSGGGGSFGGGGASGSW